MPKVRNETELPLHFVGGYFRPTLLYIHLCLLLYVIVLLYNIIITIIMIIVVGIDVAVARI